MALQWAEMRMVRWVCGMKLQNTEIMSSNSSRSLNHLLGTLSSSLMPHIHLTILISACSSAFNTRSN